MPKKKNNKQAIEPDFSFDTKRKTIEEEIDKHFEEGEKIDGGKIANISDKIREGKEIRDHLPEKGFMEVKFNEVEKKDGTKEVEIIHKDENGEETTETHNGLFCLDLRNDADFWFIRTPILMPQIYKQAIRTHLDIKKCHDPEKRKLELPIALIAILIVGTVIIILSFLSLMMK